MNKIEPRSPITVFLQWLIAALSFLWGTQARAEAPVWQPAWFAETAITVTGKAAPTSESTHHIQNRQPSSTTHTARIGSAASATAPNNALLSAHLINTHLSSAVYSASTSANPDPAQFTSYEEAPLHLTPYVTLVRIPE